MIRCRREHLAARCLERGHTMEQVAPCIVRDEGEYIVVDETHPAYPRARAEIAAPAPQPREHGKPGTALKGLLRRVGITATPTCPCNARAVQMDLWGPDECERRLDEIVGWLEEEARKRHLPFVRPAGRALVLAAIRRARNTAL